MPEISVIVPVYKVEPYLRQCINSILCQSYTDFELILVDDGSPDNCGAICEEYAAKDSRIRVIHRENGGLSAARNSGLEIASGEYFFFVDSDDLIAPDILERMMQTMLRENVSLVLCRRHDFPEDQEPPLLPGTNQPEDVLVMTGRELCIQRFNPDNRILITAWGKLFHRSLWDGHVFPVGKIHEDQFVIPIIMYQADLVAVLSAELYHYRLRKGSITSSFSRSHFDNIEGMDVVLRYYIDQNDRELTKLLKKHREKTLAQYTILARQNGIDNIPATCRMSCAKAFWVFRQNSSDDQFCDKLSAVYPRIGRCYRKFCALKRKLRKRISRP